jgi:hypothetical protein
MSCIIRCCCLACLGSVYGIAWLVSPSFRKQERERQVKEDAEHDAYIKSLNESSAKLHKLFEEADARRAQRKALETELMETNPDIRAKVKTMISGGISEEEAIRSCAEKFVDDKIQVRMGEYIRDGIPIVQARKMATNEILGTV